MKKLICTAFLCIQIVVSYSQLDVSKIVAKLNHEKLSDFAKNQEIEYYSNYNKALVIAKEMGFPISNLYGIDKKNNLIYIQDDNTIAANITKTDQLNQGGTSGYSLDGNNFIIGLWEASGIPRSAHENLSTGSVSRINVIDGTTVLSNHASHVAGTLIGDGSGNSAAKGMSSLATISAYNTTNDNAEMATAAANGLLVSNHSYGRGTGWTDIACLTCQDTFAWFGDDSPFNASGEAEGFGQYGSFARDWDVLAFNAPSYTIFKSAGNDRGDIPSSGDIIWNPNTSNWEVFNSTTDPGPDGLTNGGVGFDCMGQRSTAKNIITVGAVQDDLIMSTFSGWGPTDDGRIKPDIVGNGVGLTSSISSSNTAYASISGTSMASPNVSGSALLLQEHYQNLFGTGNFMTSAMLKALIIHSATDLGNLGPDYQFGWGLMNSASAADILNDFSNLLGPSLIDTTYTGSTQQLGFLCDCAYYQPLKFTLAYTDPAGVAQTTLDNTTPNLVNDLDMSLGSSNGKKPFVLNPSSPNNNATRGDNDRDNVEQIIFSFPQPIEVLTLDHEGSLTNNLQDYSVVATGIPIAGTCKVTSDQLPNYIDNGSYCNKSNLSSRAYIVNKTTYHRSETSITLKPGFYSGNGSTSKFEIKPPCLYFF